MATKQIPARTEITCDVCKRLCSGEKSNLRRQNGGLVIKRDGLDYKGTAVGNAGLSFDLCDDCLDAIVESINETSKELRETVGTAWGM